MGPKAFPSGQFHDHVIHSWRGRDTIWIKEIKLRQRIGGVLAVFKRYVLRSALKDLCFCNHQAGNS